MTPAEIAAKREALAAEMKALETQEQEIKQQTFAKLGEYLDEIPGKIAKIIGQESVSFADIRGFLNQREKGTLGSLVRVQSGDTTKRLTDEERKNLTADMLARAVLGKQGKPRVQISELAAKYGCSVATVNGYAPSEDELKAEMAKLAAPAAAPAQA